MQAGFLTKTPLQAAAADPEHERATLADLVPHQSTPNDYPSHPAFLPGIEPSPAGTASTPLAVAALAAMGLDIGDAAEQRSRCVLLSFNSINIRQKTAA